MQTSGTGQFLFAGSVVLPGQCTGAFPREGIHRFFNLDGAYKNQVLLTSGRGENMKMQLLSEGLQRDFADLPESTPFSSTLLKIVCIVLVFGIYRT